MAVVQRLLRLGCTQAGHPRKVRNKRDLIVMYKIWHKFFLLVLLSFLPLVSQAVCTSSFGAGTFTQQPYPGGVRLVLTTSVVLNGTLNCFISPHNLTGVGNTNGLPTKITSNGVTVDFTKVKVSVTSTISGCTIADPNSSKINIVRQVGGCAGQTIGLQFIYLLEGTSTTSADVVLFTPQISSVADRDQPTTTTSTVTFAVVKVPKSTAPTCTFSIDPPNITLDTIKLSDIQNLAAGAVVNSGQKTFEITVTCQKNALSSNQTFVPQFSPRKSAVLTGNSHVALNDGTDNGVGFKLFDFEGTALPFNTPLTDFPNSQFEMSPAFVPVTWPYTIKYAKTSKAVISGTVTSSIMITFSVR